MALSASGTYTFNGADTDYGDVKGTGIHLDVNYNITPVSGTTKYKVTISLKHYNTWRMQWTGDCYLHLSINGKKYTNSNGSVPNIRVPLNDSSSASYAGPWTYEIDLGVGNDQPINFYIYLDYTATGCIICEKEGKDPSGKGPGYTTYHGDRYSGVHFTGIGGTFSETVDVEPTVKAPVIANLKNNAELKVDNGISVSTTSKTIKLKWERTGGSAITESYYSLDNGNTWTRTVNADGEYTKIAANISGLTGNNIYTIKIRSKNSAGYSNTLSITIRTRYGYPTLGLELNSRGLESLVYKWTSDKSLASTSYKIDDGDWVSLGQTGTSGTFTVKWFNPNTAHTVYFKGTSTAAYDSREGTEKSASGTTYDIAHITKLGEYTFGLPISLDIENVSGKSLSLQIKASGNSRTPTFTLTNASAGTYTFTPTQDQLDQMYRCFTNTNSINIEFTLTTIGDNKNWADTSQTKVLTLTGIAKTAHFGVSNKPRRAQAWVGINGTPRRAVVWVGVNNTPRRCI